MIREFKCKETEKLFFRHFSKKLPQSIYQASREKLELLEAAGTFGRTFVSPFLQISLRSWWDREKDNIAVVSMTKGVCVLNGTILKPLLLKLLIITRKFYDENSLKITSYSPRRNSFRRVLETSQAQKKSVSGSERDSCSST